MDFENYYILREVLDNIPENSPAVNWHPQLRPGVFQEKYIAYFLVNKITYYVDFTKAIQFPSKQKSKKGLFGYYIFWDMYRGNNIDASLKEKEKESWFSSDFKRTHKGDYNLSNTIEVLKNVLSTMLHFVTVLKPALISYRAADTQLSRVYKLFADKHADRLGYVFSERHLIRKDILGKWGTSIEWFLKNADKVV